MVFRTDSTTVRCGFGMLGLCLAVAGCSRDPQRAAERHLTRADAYLEEGRISEAAIEYRNAVQRAPSSFEARDKLGDLLAREGMLLEASVELEVAADVLPGDPDAQSKAGEVLLAAGRPEDARDRAERALEIAPESSRGQLLLAQSLASLGDLEAAIAAARRAVDLEPESGGVRVVLGALHLQRGDRELALDTLKEAVDVEPRAQGPRLALARLQWVTGDITSAEAEFLAALDLQPGDAAANRAVAEFYARTDRLLEAGPYLEAVADVTKSPESWFALADFYLQTGRHDEAVGLLEPMVQDPRTAAAAQLLLADLDHRAGRIEQAHERLSQFREGAAALSAQLLSAELLIREGRYDEARVHAEAAIEASPAEARGHLLLARARVGASDNGGAIAALEQALALAPGDPVPMRELSRLYLATGNGERALRLAREAVAAGPMDLESRLVLTQAFLTQGLDERASAELERLVALYPEVSAVRVQQGLLAARGGRREEARDAFELALDIDPDNLAAFEGLVAIDLRSGATAVARDRVDGWIARRPEDPASLFLAARFYVDAGDTDRAERLLRRVLDVDSSHLPSYMALGRLYARQGRLREALTEYEALAQRSRDPVPALTMVGIIQQAQGLVDRAQATYERAVALDPGTAVAANNLAWIYCETGGNLDVALGLAQRATAKLPDLPQTNDTLGWVYYKKNLASLAIPYFEKSIARDGDNPVYHFHLGLAYLEVAEPVRAREALERSLSLEIGFEGAEDARRMLSDLATEEPDGV